MPHSNLERVIGAALVDHEFADSLLRSRGAAAATDFDLSTEELEVLNSANADTLEGLAAHVHAWITNAPKPRRPASSRLPAEGLKSTRVAV